MRLSWILAGALAVVACRSPQGAAPAPPAEEASSDADEEEALAPLVATFRFEHYEALFTLEIAGHGPLTFLLDTGLTPSAIDLTTARKLGLRLDEDNALTAGGLGTKRVFLYPTVLPDVVLGGAAIGSFDAVAVDLSAMAEKLGEPLHGVLGFSFLAGRVVRIDYPKRTITVGATRSQVTPQGETPALERPLAFAEDDIIPMLEVGLGERRFTATLDTGSALGLEIFTTAVDELGLAETIATWPEGQGTSAATHEGVLPRVTIGDLELRDVPVSVTPPRGADYRAGNIGNQLLQRFIVTLDYVDNRVALTHPPARG
ncbi:MAG: pepsin/retropepsin-like aspartic protease family protein [Nannocystaceae bacterium]|nr:retropepsin-like domain-containing protein [Myxococcales bacterium]